MVSLVLLLLVSGMNGNNFLSYLKSLNNFHPGATNVGSIKIYIDEHLKTNKWYGLKVGKLNKKEHFEEIELPEGTTLEKGQILGHFNMGSTVVLIFEAPKYFK